MSKPKKTELKSKVIPFQPVSRASLMAESKTIRSAIEADKELNDVIVEWVSGAEGRTTEWMSTGLPALDIAIGGRGLAMNKVIEIVGPPKCGKTTLALWILKQVQEKYGLKCVYLDVEGKMVDVKARVEALGLDSELFECYQVLYGESVYKLANTFVKSIAYGAVVIDSVASVIPQKEYTKDTNQLGNRAALNSKELPKLCGEVNKNNCLLILINQERTKMTQNLQAFKGKTGGIVIDYATVASFSMSFRKAIKDSKDEKDSKEGKGSGEKNGEDKGKRGVKHYHIVKDGVPVGQTITIEILKNQLGRTYSPAIDLSLDYSKGWDTVGSILDMGVEIGEIQRAGAWFSYVDGNKTPLKFQGKANVLEWLNAHPTIQREIADKYLKLKEETFEAGIFSVPLDEEEVMEPTDTSLGLNE